jgi:hypothetical protein
MTMRPSPEITFEIRRPLVEMRIAIRHALRDVREGIAFVVNVYRWKAPPKKMADLSAFDRIMASNINQAGRIRTLSGRMQ